MIFDGKAYAKEIEESVRAVVIREGGNRKIVSVLVGEDPASILYTNLKNKAAERVGIKFEISKKNIDITSQELKTHLEELGNMNEVAGIMIQMPIPGKTREESQEIIESIPLSKDVDGLRWEQSGTVPATVRAILLILQKISLITNLKETIWQKKYVVLGTHGSVGKPLLHFLREKGVSRIDEVNSKTQNLEEVVADGDVVISCVGRPGLVTAGMIKVQAIVVDVGINKNEEGKVVGDMTKEVYEKAAVAVPVPGGVGPVTVASLMQNYVIIAGL